MNRRQIKNIILLNLISLFGLILYINLFPVKTDVLSSLSRSYFDANLTEAYARFEKSMASQVVIMLEGESLDELVSKASELERDLIQTKLFKTLNNSQEIYRELNLFYFKHRDLFLTSRQKVLISKGSFADLEEEAQRKIYSPFFSSSYKLQVDPFLLSDAFFEDKTLPLDLVPYKGFSITKDDSPKLVMVGTIDPEVAGELLEFLINKQDKLPGLFFSSLSFYAHEARSQAQSESSIFSMISILCILVIFWFYFRTLRHLLIAISLLILCCTVGLFVTSLFFGSLFLMTLLLGICILGIMSDYFIHYFVKEYNTNLKDGKDAFRAISLPLKYSLLTSLAGYLLFILAPLPILKEFSVFTTTTLIVAFLAVKIILPKFYLQEVKVPFRGFLFNEKVCDRLGIKKISGLLIILVLLLSFLSLRSESIINSDIRKFSTPNILLQSHEEKIKDALNVKFGFQQFLVRGKSEQAVLENEQKLKTKLKRIDGSTQFFSDWVPSVSEQLLSKKLYNSIPKYLELNSSPLTPDVFIDDFSEADIAKLWIGNISGEYFSIVPVYSNNSHDDFTNLNSPNWVYMNKVSFINHDLENFIRWLILGGGVFVLLFGVTIILKLGMKSFIGVIFPPITGITIALLLSLLIFGSLNLFHFLGCVLILGLGIDYSFFYLFNRKGNELTALAIEISSLTTLASFGILAMSSTIAVSSFGTTVLIGIVICWLITPMIQNRRHYV